MNEKADIIAIGESLVELSTSDNLSNAKTLDKYYGGDTLTTAIAALRSGAKVGFITRIGTDSFKNYLLESWQDEGLDISNVKPADSNNGLYILSKSRTGEKNEFTFYRKKTAATELSIDDIIPEYISSASVLYSTGITQSLSVSAREAVLKAFKIAKENNVTTAYDLNFNPRIWSEEEAKDAFNEIAEYIDILFLNIRYDTKIVTDAESVDNIIKSVWDKGISTVIIRTSVEKGYYVGSQGKIEFIKYLTDEVPVDDTGAGDTFNGGVLYGISSGMNPFRAVSYGAVVAGLQIKNYGAIKSIPSKEEIDKIFKGQNE